MNKSYTKTNAPFEIEVVDVDSEGSPINDLGYGENVRSQARDKSVRDRSEANGKKYGWAFFVAFSTFGMALTASTEIPFFILAGTALGFLFFVPAFYDKVMTIFE